MSVGKVFTKFFDGENFNGVVQFFELGARSNCPKPRTAGAMLSELSKIQGLLEKTKKLGLGASEPDAVRAGAAEFILEGLYAHRRISRNEEVGFTAETSPPGAAGRRPAHQDR